MMENMIIRKWQIDVFQILCIMWSYLNATCPVEENEKDKKSIRILNYYYCTFLLNIYLLGSADDAMLETFPKIKRSNHINRNEDFPSK